VVGVIGEPESRYDIRTGHIAPALDQASDVVSEQVFVLGVALAVEQCARRGVDGREGRFGRALRSGHSGLFDVSDRRA
jgi:hypothetical protein